MRRPFLISLGVLPAVLLSIPTCAETPAERWERADHLYRQRCSMDGPRGTPEYIRCIDRWVDTGGANTPTKRQVDPGSLEGRLTERYGERCELAGYSPGTGAFGQCLLSYANRDDAQKRQILLQPERQQMQQAARSIMSPKIVLPNAITCTSIVGNTIVQTTCR